MARSASIAFVGRANHGQSAAGAVAPDHALPIGDRVVSEPYSGPLGYPHPAEGEPRVAATCVDARAEENHPPLALGERRHVPRWRA